VAAPKSPAPVPAPAPAHKPAAAVPKAPSPVPVAAPAAPVAAVAAALKSPAPAASPVTAAPLDLEATSFSALQHDSFHGLSGLSLHSVMDGEDMDDATGDDSQNVEL
jgi:hypothetical protein